MFGAPSGAPRRVSNSVSTKGLKNLNAPSHTSEIAPTTTRIRVVVVDHDGGEMTLACLERIIDAGTPAGTELEVVLVDNGSRRSVADEVVRRWPRVDVRRSSTNRGFAGGNNLALRDLERVDFVALVNNDVMVSDGWLEPLLDVLRSDETVGAAAPKLLFADRFRELELQAAGHVAGRGDRRLVGVRWFGIAGSDGVSVRGQLVDGFLGPQRTSATEWFEWTRTARSSARCRARNRERWLQAQTRGRSSDDRDGGIGRDQPHLRGRTGDGLV